MLTHPPQQPCCPSCLSWTPVAVLFFGANLAGMSSRDVAQPIIGAQLQCRLQCLGLASKRGLRSGTWQHRTCSLEVSSFFFSFALTIVLPLSAAKFMCFHTPGKTLCRSPFHQLLAKLLLSCYSRPGHSSPFLLLFLYSALSGPISSWSWPDFSHSLWAAMVCTVHQAVWMWFCIQAGSYLRSPWYHPGWAAGEPSLAGSCRHSQYMLEEQRYSIRALHPQSSRVLRPPGLSSNLPYCHCQHTIVTLHCCTLPHSIAKPARWVLSLPEPSLQGHPIPPYCPPARLGPHPPKTLHERGEKTADPSAGAGAGWCCRSCLEPGQ